MPESSKTLRIGQAADLMGVSVDTIRRWTDAGRIPTIRTRGGQRLLDGAALARFMASLGDQPSQEPIAGQSARNRFPGIVTRVVKDTVMAQVEIQSGTRRIVSLMSREAADELRLEPGVLAIAAVKATNVVVELPAPRASQEDRR